MQRFSSCLLILTLSATGYGPAANAVVFPELAPPSHGILRLEGSSLIALKRTVSSDVAERGFTARVSRGVGLVLNLSALGEGISKVWLSDPSKLVFSSQGSVIYLKPIQPLSFPGNYHSADGTTLLTVVTQSGKVLQFTLEITSGQPAYTALDVTPQGMSPNPSPFPARYPSTDAYRPRHSNRSMSRAPLPLPKLRSTPSIADRVKTAPATTPSTATTPSSSGWTTIKPFIPTAPVLPQNTPTFQPQSAAPASSGTPKAVAKVPADVPSPTSAVPAISIAEPLTPKTAVHSTLPSKPLQLAIAVGGPTALANAVSRGLPIALHQKEIRLYSSNYDKVQSAIRLLRNHKAKTLPDAATKTGLQLALLNRIETLGHQSGTGYTAQASASKDVLFVESSNPPSTAAVTSPVTVPKPHSNQAGKRHAANALVMTKAKQKTDDNLAITPADSPQRQRRSPATLANALSRGLPVAIHKKEIRLYSDTYYKVQSAIGLLRSVRVKTIPDAATKAGLEVALLNQLDNWGTKQQ